MFRLGKILFIAILSCLTACNCNDDVEENIIYSCSVPQVPLDIDKEELVLVESEAELNRIFAGYTKDLPQINFRKSKLLLIHGSHIKHVKEITLDSFDKDDTGDSYYMHINVETEDINKDCYWTAAYLVPRSFNTPICLFLSISHRFQLPAGKWLYFKK